MLPISRALCLGTGELIAEYKKAIARPHTAAGQTSPRQRRINMLVTEISNRADDGDAAALVWYEEN